MDHCFFFVCLILLHLVYRQEYLTVLWKNTLLRLKQYIKLCHKQILSQVFPIYYVLLIMHIMS